MGEWSPECTSGRWVAPAEGPAVGARFEGDNAATMGPITLKRWTTTSEVTACVPGELFEFVAEGMTTWRYELAEADGTTTLTESFRYPPQTGLQGFLYGTLARRPADDDQGHAEDPGPHQAVARVLAAAPLGAPRSGVVAGAAG